MAMRSVANFSISLGLFGFPVKVYKATNDPADGVGFRQLHAGCVHPIHLVKHCAACDADVPSSDVVKGFEHAPGQFVTFTDAEIKAVKPEGDGSIAIDGYLASDEIDESYMDGTVYFLSPDRGKNGKGDCASFTTWRDALKGRWAIGKAIMGGREHVVAIRALDRVLSLHFLRTHAEIRHVGEIPGYDNVPERSLAAHMALMAQLIDAKRIAFDDVVLESDAYADAVKAMIAARVSGESAPEASDGPVEAVVSSDSLLAMLTASLAAANG